MVSCGQFLTYPCSRIEVWIAIFDEATAAKEGDAAAPSSEADGRRLRRRHHALAVLVVEVADDAALLKSKLTQAQIDELGQRLAEADVSFGIVKSSSGGEFSGKGGRNVGSTNFGNRAAAAVWIARGKANKSHALAACRADLSAKQASAQIGVTLAANRIEQHEAGDIFACRLAGQRAVAPAPRPTYRGGCSCGPRARPPASVGKPVLTSTCALWGLLWGLLGASSLARHAGVLGHR